MINCISLDFLAEKLEYCKYFQVNFISETPNDKAERESRAGTEEVEERFQEELQDVINRRKGLEYRYRNAHHVFDVLFC
jgi:hypothetical protein